MFKPVFTITPEINSRIAEIERLKALASQAVILPEIEVRMRFRASVESTHSSTSIEGNPLTSPEVQKVLKGEKITAPAYAITEVLNYKKALNWIHASKKSGLETTSKDVLRLHHIVASGLLSKTKTGHWRPGVVYIVDEVDGNEIIQYVGPDAKKVPKLVTSLLKWIPLQLSERLHPVLLAGLIHYLFISIHPFSDGNGRVTRLLVYKYLREWGFDFRESISLDTYYLLHQNEYYEALSLGNTFDSRMEANITPFLDFFTKGFLEVATNLNQHIVVAKSLNSDLPLRLSPEEFSILEYAHQFNSITITEAAEILRTSKRTSLRLLQKLVQKNILSSIGRGPATRYVLVSNLENSG